MPNLTQQLDRVGDIIQLKPEMICRFYPDGARIEPQPPKGKKKPTFYRPERWIGSSTHAVNRDPIPGGGLSTCAELKLEDQPITLRRLLSDEEAGPRLLGEKRYKQHEGSFRVLIKLLDPGMPIPMHVHADDAFVSENPDVFPRETFGKEEAYHILEAPKGPCAYTHLGLHKGVTAKDLLRAMERGTDYVLDLSPSLHQRFGEGLIVKAGLLHRPGTALALEIQQPSDVSTFFQKEFGTEPLPADFRHRGFASQEEAAEKVICWEDNQREDLQKVSTLRVEPVTQSPASGGKLEWAFSPDASTKFSGMRLTVETEITYKVNQPYVLFVWQGKGSVEGRGLEGRRGATGGADEYFIGAAAAKRGLLIKNTGEEPMVAFALFGPPV